MWRLFKVIFFLALLASAFLVVYAYAGPIFFPSDFAAPTAEVSQPVILEIE